MVSLEMGGQAGYRLESLDWNIAGNSQGSNPNILSELRWRDVRSAYIEGRGVLSLAPEKCGGFSPRLFALVGHGHIVSGENQDSDYRADNRQGEFSRSNNGADDGSLFDFSVGLGNRFFFDHDRFSLTPQLGYAYFEQNLTLVDGWQTIPANQPINGLDSSYKTQWEGPWLGLVAGIHPFSRLAISVDMAYYFTLSYWAEAHWNLRQDLAPLSFQHKASDGHGYSVAVAGDYALVDHWRFFGRVEYRSFSISDGSSWTYYRSGTVGLTRLNEANWSARLFVAGLQVSF